MQDVFSISLQSVAAHSAAAPALVFAAGLLSSVGPCTAPRLVAVASLVTKREPSRAHVVAGVFAAGLVFAYASFGIAAIVLVRALQSTAAIYAVLSLVLAASGILTLWRTKHDCAKPGIAAPRSLGGVFVLGASFALVVSPCCTPIVSAILAYGGTAATPIYTCFLLSCFAAGHSMVLFLGALSTAGIEQTLRRFAAHDAAATVSGALLLALAGYYGVLA